MHVVLPVLVFALLRTLHHDLKRRLMVGQYFLVRALALLSKVSFDRDPGRPILLVCQSTLSGLFICTFQPQMRWE